MNDAVRRERVSERPHRIGVIGAGAMGVSLAAIAARVVPTVMVVRNPRRAAQIFDRGAVVEGLVNAHARPLIVKHVEDLASLDDIGTVFIATKTTAIPSVCAELKPVLNDLGAGGKPVRLVSYQNGIDPGREIMRLLQWPRIVRMVLNYGARLDEDTGVAHVSMHNPPHVIGCVDPDLVQDCHELATLLTNAEFPTEYVPDIERHVWIKSILNASMSPVAALVDSSIGGVLDSPAVDVARNLLRESIRVARAEGIPIDDDFEATAFDLFERGRDHTPSMVEDIRGGRESEVGQLNRQIIEHARRLDVHTPTHETIDALIEAFDWRIYQHYARQKRAEGGA